MAMNLLSLTLLMIRKINLISLIPDSIHVLKNYMTKKFQEVSVSMELTLLNKDFQMLDD